MVKENPKKKKIIDIATKLFNAKGYYLTSFQDIVDKSEMELSLIKSLFPGEKLDILKEISENRRDKSLTKILIVETMRRDIEENGYLHVSTNHIAEETKKSIAIVYKYFPRGRVDILREILAQQMNEFLGDLSSSGSQIESFPNLDTFLSVMLKRYILFHRKNLAVNKAFQIAALSDPTLYNEIYSVFADIEKVSLKFTLHHLYKLNIIPSYINKPDIAEKKVNRILKIIENTFILQLNFGVLFSKDEELFQYMIDLTRMLIEYEFKEF